MLETEPALAEIDLASDAGVNHPLESAINRCTTDSMIFAPDDIDEVVGAEVPLLAKEHIDDLFALARAFAAVWLQPAEIRKRAVHRGTPPALPRAAQTCLPRRSRNARRRRG